MKSFSTIVKAGLATAAMAAAMALPMGGAQAATSSPSISFSLSFGNAGRVCLTNSQVRSELRDEGFRNVTVVRSLGNHRVLAVATWHGKWYQLRVNTCTGRVDSVKRVYRNSAGNFTFSFNFGGGGISVGGGNGGNGGNGGSAGRELVCLVTFFDESDVAAGADADVQRARVMTRDRAEMLDGPNDRNRIFDYGSDQQTVDTCNYLDNLNN